MGRKGGVIAALALVALAPLTAEFLFGYLDVTGDVSGTAFTWVFFLPLYGAMALLIRELSIRCGGGWPARLLWGAAFGLAMTALIDLSLFTRERSEISFWADIVEPTRIEALGISAFPLISWVLGHVVLSTAAPIAFVETLAGPRLAARSWVPWPWLALAALSFVAIALMLRADEMALWGADPSTTQSALAAAGCAGFVTLGLLAGRGHRAGPGPDDHEHRASGQPWPPWATGLLTGLSFAAVNSFPSWWGTVAGAFLIIVVLALVRHWSAHSSWSQRHLAAAAYGPVLSTVLLAFLTPPAEGATSTGVVAQAGVLTVLTLLLGLALHRRTRET